jgi:6-pyruvoyltetrahydropterin/6-carboxytetrahydropterin synthase
MQPSTENVAIWIWKELEKHISECKLHCVKLQETDNIFVEYFG